MWPEHYSPMQLCGWSAPAADLCCGISYCVSCQGSAFQRRHQKTTHQKTAVVCSEIREVKCGERRQTGEEWRGEETASLRLTGEAREESGEGINSSTAAWENITAFRYLPALKQRGRVKGTYRVVLLTMRSYLPCGMTYLRFGGRGRRSL